MSNRFASEKHAIAICDRCGFRYKLKELQYLTIKLKLTNIRVCPPCWEQDHPQLQVGMWPIDDPQALKNARPDTTYISSGTDNLGYPQDGSRVFEWGWAPIGGASSYDADLTPNSLVTVARMGDVTIDIT